MKGALGGVAGYGKGWKGAVKGLEMMVCCWLGNTMRMEATEKDIRNGMYEEWERLSEDWQGMGGGWR